MLIHICYNGSRDSSLSIRRLLSFRQTGLVSMLILYFCYYLMIVDIGVALFHYLAGLSGDCFPYKQVLIMMYLMKNL